MTVRHTAGMCAAAALAASLLGAGVRADDPHRAQLDGPAPSFSLKDTQDEVHTLKELTDQGKVVVLEWFDPDCPYVQKHHIRHDTWEQLVSRYRDQGVAFLAINSTSARYEAGSLERNYEAKEAFKLTYPLLLDPTGVVGRAYGATNASQVVVIDRRGTVVYMGAVDEDPSAEDVGAVNYVALALDAVLQGRPVDTPTTRPYGCPIRY